MAQRCFGFASRYGRIGGEDSAQWIEPPLPPLAPAKDGAGAATGADVVQAPPDELDGASVTVLYSTAARPCAMSVSASAWRFDVAAFVNCLVGGDCPPCG